VYIRRLRAKLEQPGGPPLIITQPRAGYRIAGELDWIRVVTLMYGHASGLCLPD
jgi:DNA-binding winged helix-turn-helix (wHTH) protein